jgi:hypothetical protein
MGKRRTSAVSCSSSSRIILANSSGVLPIGEAPSTANDFSSAILHGLAHGRATDWVIAAGVPSGANSPYQVSPVICGKPDSMAVGTRQHRRAQLAGGPHLSVPDFMCGMTAV